MFLSFYCNFCFVGFEAHTFFLEAHQGFSQGPRQVSFNQKPTGPTSKGLKQQLTARAQAACLQFDSTLPSPSPTTAHFYNSPMQACFFHASPSTLHSSLPPTACTSSKPRHQVSEHHAVCSLRWPTARHSHAKPKRTAELRPNDGQVFSLA